MARSAFATLIDDLAAFYCDEEIAMWLAEPHTLLQGRTAIDAIRDGQIADVQRVADMGEDNFT